VTHDRHHKSWWKRALSAALAQFVAIQLVLSAAAAVQMVTAAPVDAAVLCADNHGGTSGDGGQNHVVVHHGFCAVCTYAAHGAPLPGAISVHHEGCSFAHAPRPNTSTVAITSRQHDPRTSQGPPLST
jgi:hypothetical protein